jgi:DNA-binding FadR family transcriptional regulator
MAETHVVRRKLGDEVVERLLRQIRAGAFKPGDLLPPERALMEVFGVGRPAIREAIQKLQHMGLLTVLHGEGARVLAPSADAMTRQIAETVRQLLSTEPQSLEDLKEARLFFEVGMVRIAAARATPAQVEAIRAALDDQRAAAVSDPGCFLMRDMAFHRAIAAVSGNAIYRALSQALFAWLGEFHTEMVRLTGAERLTLREHARILRGIEAHDVEGAARAMTEHLTRANALYRIFERPTTGDGTAP